MKAIGFGNPAMNTQNSHNRFQENHINEEQKTKESSNKASSQVVRKNYWDEIVNYWDEIVEEQQTSSFDLKNVLLGEISNLNQETLRQKMGEKEYNMYLKTLDSQSEGLISSGNFDKFA